MEKLLPSEASLALFCNLIALVLVYNSVKDLRVTKTESNLKESGGKLESKKCFWRQTKCFKSVLLVLTKLSFWQEDWRLGHNSMKFRYFPDIS